MADAALSRTDIDDEAELEQEFAASDTVSGAALISQDNDRLDFFVTREGVTFAGHHLIVDLWDAEGLDDPRAIENALVKAARRAGATVLSADFHHFQPNGGVSGVVVLAESHISIHTWPERNFAAVDVFMCGDCVPEETIPVLQEAFNPSRIGAHNIRRGIVD